MGSVESFHHVMFCPRISDILCLIESIQSSKGGVSDRAVIIEEKGGRPLEQESAARKAWHFKSSAGSFNSPDPASSTCSTPTHCSPNTTPVSASGDRAVTMSSRRNLTGFDAHKFAAASGQPANDPWARRYVLLTPHPSTIGYICARYLCERNILTIG